MIYLTKRVHFCASHRLHSPEFSDEENRRIYGACNNPRGHGHNYVLDVTLAGTPDPRTGMIMDLKEIARVVGERIVEEVDHRHLNHDVPWLAGVIPTVENLIREIWRRLEATLPPGTLYELRLWETDTSWAVYRGE
jgi:6-pyruvoyltetrahydropterin/6-carboxytetrahydropterin synthase